MELYEIIGIQHKTGIYNGQPYDNMIFFVTQPADASKGEQGLIASQLRVKTSLLTTIPGIGDTVSPLYNRYGRVIGFN